ncbi:hypothetical protein WDU94_001707 [Cyamophila willieti]
MSSKNFLQILLTYVALLQSEKSEALGFPFLKSAPLILSCYHCDSSQSAHCETISNDTQLIQCAPFSYCMKSWVQVSNTLHVRRGCISKSSQFGAALKSHCVQVLTDVELCLCEQHMCNHQVCLNQQGFVLFVSMLTGILLR